MQQRDRHTGTARRRTQPLSEDRRRSARKAQRPVREPQPFLPGVILGVSMALIALLMLFVAGETDLGTGHGGPRVVSTPAGAVSTQVANVDELFTNPYDWSNLKIDENGRYVYERDGQVVSRAGIDVSEHQGDIDWQAVAADGIDFAFVRVGYRGTTTGNITGDSTFSRNLEEAREAGLDVGVYFYSLATTADEAREEAQFVLEALNGTQLEYPVAFDMEPTADSSDRLHGLDKDTMTEIAQAFCETVTKAGYSATIYGNQTDLSRYHLMRLAEYGFWYAQYGSEPSMSLSFGMWQYTKMGNVKGITGNNGEVDLDLDLTSVMHGE